MLPPSPSPQAGAPAQASSPPANGIPSLASAPGQNSALGGSPVGLSGSSDPRQILAKAQMLLKSGAITEQQYQMIMAKLGVGGGKPGGAPGAAPGAPPQGAPMGAAPPMGAPQGGPPMGQPPSPQWGS